MTSVSTEDYQRVYHMGKRHILFHAFWNSPTKAVCHLIPDVEKIYVNNLQQPFLSTSDKVACGYWTNVKEVTEENPNNQLSLF